MTINAPQSIFNKINLIHIENNQMTMPNNKCSGNFGCKIMQKLFCSILGNLKQS